MQMINDVLVELDILRQDVHETAIRKGLSHPDVLNLSQKLDSVLSECNYAYYMEYIRADFVVHSPRKMDQLIKFKN